MKVERLSPFDRLRERKPDFKLGTSFYFFYFFLLSTQHFFYSALLFTSFTSFYSALSTFLLSTVFRLTIVVAFVKVTTFPLVIFLAHPTTL
jgi:hypothetical protein